MSAVCDLRIEKDRSVRRRCPKCKKLRYGRMVHYYDTVRVFLECGVMLDFGYECWMIDDREKSRQWHGQRTRGALRK